MNYLGTGSQYLTGAEAVADSDAGLSICSVYEVTIWNGVNYNPNIASNIPGYFGICLGGTSTYQGNIVSNGFIDGINAFRNAVKVGQPSGSAIYFAIDADTAGSSAYMSDVINYFEGIAQAFSYLSQSNPSVQYRSPR